MGEVVITQEQADRINYFRKDDERKGDAIRYHLNKWLAPVNMCLNELTLDQLTRALYVGYEVEENFKVGDLIIDKNDNYKTVIEITEIETFHLFGNWSDERGQEIGICIMMKYARHATESEIAGEEKSRMDKKINEIWIGLSDYERNGFYRKLVRGEY